MVQPEIKNIVVGIASLNEADSISYPTQKADEGLKKYYPNKSSIILNCDNNSADNTKKAFLDTKTQSPKLYIGSAKGTKGKGYNIRNMMKKALALKAEVLICLDADLSSITPKWVKLLADPVLKGADFVTPIYSRHKNDGLITKNLCFPLIYGLFCQNIRQPIGGDFAMSRKFIKHMLNRKWDKNTLGYGVDIFMTINAISGEYQIDSADLGSKLHKPSCDKLGNMFDQVAKTAFDGIIKTKNKWKNLPSVSTNPKPDETAEKWTKYVYETISKYENANNKNRLINSLKKEFFSHAEYFKEKTKNSSPKQTEQVVLNQAGIFLKNRNYL